MTSRGKNFTEREKCKLLEVIQKYKHIIENKNTNAVYTIQKNATWETITQEFNSTAEIPRTRKQLNTAYLNLKRVTRKNVASENVKRYLERTQNSDSMVDVAGPSQVLSLTDESFETEELRHILKQFKKDEIADKKGVRGTGGGTYTQVLSNVGAQMLAVMGNQVKPLSNNCDSASSYFINDEDPIDPLKVHDILVMPDADDNFKPHDDFHVNEFSPPPPTQMPTSTNINAKSTIVRKRKNVPKKKEKNELLKTKLYEKKMESAILEKRTKLIEYRCALKKEKLLDLEIKLRQKEYENLATQ